MNKIKAALWFISIFLIIAIGLWHGGTVGAEKPTHSPTEINTHIEWETNTQVTFDAVEKEGPIMRVSPDSETLLIAYNVIRDGSEDKFDVLYAESVDQGATWITSTIQAETGITGTISSQVDLEYDASGTAHAVWVYGSALAYGRYSEWDADIPFKPYDPAFPNFVLYPNIIASGDETLDIVWSASSNIMHMRSTNGGDNWGLVEDVSPLSAFKTSIDIAVQEDNLHVVWEDVNTTNLVSGTIVYSQGDATVSPVVWSEPITISKVISTGIHDAHETSITVNNNTLQVAYTHRQTKETQWVYITQCSLSLDCTQVDNWDFNDVPISGAELGVNAEAPWNVFTDLISYNGCVYAHFHGTTTDYDEDNELIWSTNSCSNWANNGNRQELTNPQVQALFPSATVSGQRVYMAYGQNPTLGDPYHQIFFRRGAATGRQVYLPVILK